MYAIDICEGSSNPPEYINGSLIFKFKDCYKKVDFYILTEVMFKLNKQPKEMTYDEYIVYATTVKL